MASKVQLSIKTLSLKTPAAPLSHDAPFSVNVVLVILAAAESAASAPQSCALFEMNFELSIINDLPLKLRAPPEYSPYAILFEKLHPIIVKLAFSQ